MFDQCSVEDHDVVRFVYGTPDSDGLFAQAGKSKHRRTTPLDPKLGEGLNVEAFVKRRPSQNLGGDDGTLPSPSVDSDFNHEDTPPGFPAPRPQGHAYAFRINATSVPRWSFQRSGRIALRHNALRGQNVLSSLPVVWIG
jgi:hypothetical protein